MFQVVFQLMRHAFVPLDQVRESLAVQSSLESKMYVLMTAIWIESNTVECCEQLEIAGSKMVSGQELPLVGREMLLKLTCIEDCIDNPGLNLVFSNFWSHHFHVMTLVSKVGNSF